MRKKGIVFLLVLAMALSAFLIGCTPKEEDVVTPDPVTPVEPADPVEPDEPEDTKPTEPTGQITIGNTTELGGDWSAPYFSNNAADADVMDFTKGYGTVDMTFDGEYLVNDTVVANYETVDHDDGSKEYIWTIKDGLTFADGTPITAKHYVAAPMLWSSKLVGDMGASNTYGRKYVGWGAYSKGETKEFTGVRLLDDMKFSVTVSSEELPYFYELANVGVAPVDFHFWTDETVDIMDDGNGAYFSDNFTLENFEESITKGRRTIPRPSTGAYTLKSFDESTRVAVLEANENYLGNYEGQKPLIKTIIYKKINQDTAMDELSTGAVDLISQTAGGDEINAGLDLVDKGGFDYISYPRAGYGKLLFIADHGPTSFIEVRHAIAHLLDRNDFAKSFTGGFGSVINGPFGEAQWFYQETKAELNEKLNQYPYSLETAIELLEEGGWVYDANGGEYKEGIRHKKLDDGTLMPLVIEWASTTDNAVSDLLVVKLQENEDTAAAGMKINQTLMQFPELLNWLYRDTDEDPKYGVPTYHMMNLASNFYPEYDPTTTYTTDPDLVKQGANQNYLLDEDLAAKAAAIALTDSEDVEGFKQKFVDYIVKWNELLPDLPLYSNIYHDFFNEKLKGYDKNPLIRVSHALLYSWVEE